MSSLSAKQAVSLKTQKGLVPFVHPHGYSLEQLVYQSVVGHDYSDDRQRVPVTALLKRSFKPDSRTVSTTHCLLFERDRLP